MSAIFHKSIIVNFGTKLDKKTVRILLLFSLNCLIKTNICQNKIQTIMFFIIVKNIDILVYFIYDEFRN